MRGGLSRAKPIVMALTVDTHSVEAKPLAVPLDRHMPLRTTLVAYSKCRYLFALLIPAITWYIVFRYGPMYGLQIAFKDFQISKGIWRSAWAGLKYFNLMFTAGHSFTKVFVNTLILSVYHIVFGFPAPIVLAILMNELRFRRFKKTVQTLSYLPHFMSWVILTGIITVMLSPETGPVNVLLKAIGLRPVFFLGDSSWFRFTLVATAIWKDVGWGTIVYLAALSAIDPQLYEAATVDGANRLQRIRHITLPSLFPVISILLILRMGDILDAGFDQVLNLYNAAVMDVADIIDTYVYRLGLGRLEFSLATAVGLFKNVIAFALVVAIDRVVKWLGQPGLF